MKMYKYVSRKTNKHKNWKIDKRIL